MENGVARTQPDHAKALPGTACRFFCLFPWAIAQSAAAAAEPPAAETSAFDEIWQLSRLTEKGA
jgi:hypothetical protein